jgi:hypothetical protein
MATKRTRQPLTVADLADAVAAATSGGAAWGANLHPSKEVLVRSHGHVYPLTKVAAAFVDGRFALVLEFDDTQPTGSER